MADLLDAHGRRRIDDPHDWVAEEIRVALDRRIRVIPILVDGARMPEADELPPSLARLAARQALTLRHESFVTDTARLVAAIQGPAAAAAAPESAPAAAPSDTIPDSTIAAWYATGLHRLAAGEWAEAAQAFTAVQQHRSDYRDTTMLLSSAQEQQWLSGMDALASQAASQNDWQRAISALRQIVAVQPDYRGAAMKLADAESRLRPATQQSVSQTSGHKNSTRKWIIGVGVGSAAALTLVVAATALSLLTGGQDGPSPTPSPTSDLRTDPGDLAYLIGQIPESFSDTCIELPRPEESILASVACSPADGPGDVFFDLHASEADAQAAFDDWALPSQGDCSSGPGGGIYTVDGADAGAMGCTTIGDSNSFIWYDYDLAILGLAASDTLEYSEIYDWWLTAGPG